MKKLIAIAVVLVLAVGSAFAVDLGGTVFGHVNVLQGDSGKDAAGDANPVTAGGGMDRLRLEGSGEAGEGKFGGWIRLGDGDTPGFNGIAWWKPIDQFKLSIGGNPDGIWGKEGVTGWMFNQNPYDSGIALGTGNIWGWGDTVAGSLQTRFAFFSGYGDRRAAIEIKPLDMLSINIAVPFIAKNGEKAEDVFKATIAQLDLNFDFGNIAITYDGSSHFGDPAIFAYFGGSFGDLGLDVGLGYHLPGEDEAHPFFAGLGLKYASGAFGVKFRTALGIPAEDTQAFNVLIDVLPYYAINDNISAFLNAGFGITSPKEGDSAVGFYVNPYLRVGAEWGPSFYAGLQIFSAPAVDGKFASGPNAGKDSYINWAVPISIMVSF